MTDEAPFRIALAVIFLLTTAIAMVFRLRAGASGERVSRGDEGLVLAISLRLAGLVLWIAAFAYLLAPKTVQWASLPLPAWVRWLGAMAGLANTVLMAWTLSSLGKNLTDTVATRADATLVTAGPYRWVRHPYYVVAALLMASVSLLTANVLIAVVSVAVLTLLAVRTPKEEQKLIEKFGDDYRRYMATTGRYFPRLR